jgi:hypothetical protein
MKLNEIVKELRNIISNRQEELNLTFKEEDHIYSMNGRTDYPSVSKVLKKFYREFPTEEAAYNKSGGDPIKQQKLIEEWSAAGTYSTNLGSRVHYFLEKKIIEMYGGYKDVRQPIFECDLDQIIKGDNMIIAGNRYLELMKSRGAYLLDTETVLGDPELGFTGQPDKIWIIENKEKNDFGFVITDWKTNKSKSFQVTKYTDSMYEPFENYPNNALGHYYLQLPLYGRLLLKMLQGSKYGDVKLYGCIISHLREDQQFEEFRVPKEIITKVLNMDIQKYLKS